MTSDHSDKNKHKPETKHQPALGYEKGHISVRVLGVFILLIEFGLLFAYGFSGYIINEVGSWGGSIAFTNSLINGDLIFGNQGAFFYMTTLIFALIGFGCLFAAISRTTLSGFFVSFFVVGFTTIFSPTLQKFWFNVFSTQFSNDSPVINTDLTGVRDYLHYLSSSQILISFYQMRLSLLNAISQLIVFYGIYQKINAGQIFLFSVLFQIFWTLNFALNAELARYQPDATRRLFDDYAINQVFLFGAVFGLMVAILNKKPPREDLAMGKGLPKLQMHDPQMSNNELPLITSLIGTFLLFLTFMGITICFPVKTGSLINRTRYAWAQGYMNIIFALCASVFTNMFMSSIIKKKFGLRQIHFGMIGGAIIAGPVAGTLDNIGSFMALGTFAGIISAIYFGKVHPKINRHTIFDTYGAIYIALISFLGTMFISPIVIIGMVRNDVNSNLLMNVLIPDSASAGWVLVYVGISVGIALVGGLFVGLILKCFGREVVRQFEDENIFVPLPGLYDEAYLRNRSRMDNPYTNHSASQLRGNPIP